MTTEERLGNLERELTAVKRRNRWMLGGVALLILGCLTIAATSGDKQAIRAKSFILEDENGEIRAVLDVGKHYGVALGMYGVNGGGGIFLNVNEDDEPALSMHGTNGKTRIDLRLNKDGDPGLNIWGTNNRGLLTLSVNKDGDPGLFIYDANKEVRVGLGVFEGGKPYLVMWDASGEVIRSIP